MKPRFQSSLYLDEADKDALHEAMALFEEAPRHLIVLSAFRLGIALLRKDPEAALANVTDQSRARKARVRTTT